MLPFIIYLNLRFIYENFQDYMHLKLAIKAHSSRWQTKLMIQMRSIHNLSSSGRNLCVGSLLGISGVGGAMYLSPNAVYAMSAARRAAYDSDIWLASPIILAVNVALLLFCTRPSPFSVYIFIEQLRRRAMRQNPGLSKTKLFYAKKVEVQDYKLLCFARVELRDAKLSLIGILGSWWILQSS
ncbi:unnamed protein product [Spirodela intermedia]|uniref:Uncharacterized protein n=1 Tax=Spirodela intermedia TaxID=51605 RepID=A0A7I8JSJ0_SPIIN|nr:unnamed protein product [Spirodela intermedia]CAA6673089.1 unnamed protein product [Spirodela intermedia]